LAFDGEDVNTMIGTASTVASWIPGVGPMAGLINSAIGLTSGAEATANSSGTDQGLNAAGVMAGLAGMPLQLMQMAGLAGGTEAGVEGALALGGGAGAAGGAAAVGGVVGAGLAGYGAGNLLAKVIDSGSTGIFGKDPDTGKPMSMFDAAAATGHTVEKALGGGTLATIAGAGVTGVTSLLNAPLGLLDAAATGIGHLFGGGSKPAESAPAPEAAPAS
jgi:hypothetical protein